MRGSTSRMVIQKAYINILISFHKFPTLLMVWWFEPVQLGSAWFESLAKPPGSGLGFSLRFGVVWFQVWPKMAKNLTKPNLSNTTIRGIRISPSQLSHGYGSAFRPTFGISLSRDMIPSYALHCLPCNFNNSNIGKIEILRRSIPSSR